MCLVLPLAVDRSLSFFQKVQGGRAPHWSIDYSPTAAFGVLVGEPVPPESVKGYPAMHVERVPLAHECFQKLPWRVGWHIENHVKSPRNASEVFEIV